MLFVGIIGVIYLGLVDSGIRMESILIRGLVMFFVGYMTTVII